MTTNILSTTRRLHLESQCPPDAQPLPNLQGMSNCDHSIDDGFEAALRAAPLKVYGRHAGWNFNGLVWFDGKDFVEEVWVYHVPRTVITAPTLEQLMQDVNDQFGHD